MNSRVSACLSLCILVLETTGFETQAQERYLSEVFSSYQLQADIKYGESVDVGGTVKSLLLDVYTPPPYDTIPFRPLIVFIHGGGFQSNDKVGPFSTSWLTRFAQHGYTCASINYRLGIGPSRSNVAYFEALYRAIQDGKAAVRFLRQNARQYGVDTSRIYVTGTSAGSITAIHMAYLDQNEVPSFIDPERSGTLEGTSGNPGYSSKVHGVINNWGCIVDWKWIQKGDVPIYNVHGLDDKTVPNDSSFDYHGMKYGSQIIYSRAKEVGIPTGLRKFANTGHTLDMNSSKMDSAFTDMNAWLYTILKKGSVNSRSPSQ